MALPSTLGGFDHGVAPRSGRLFNARRPYFGENPVGLLKNFPERQGIMRRVAAGMVKEALELLEPFNH